MKLSDGKWLSAVLADLRKVLATRMARALGVKFDALVVKDKRG